MRPLCSISFDDGLATLYTHVLPILKEFGIPSTVFVNTVAIDNTNLTWIHLLNWLFSTVGAGAVSERMNSFDGHGSEPVPGEARQILDWYKRHYCASTRAGLLGRLCRDFGVDVRGVAQEEKVYLTWSQIREMQGVGVTFGSHSHSHAPLANLSAVEDIRAEINGAIAELARHNQNTSFIAFPFGTIDDYGRDSTALALSAGHTYVLEVGDGTNDVSRVRNQRVFSRVGLGPITADAASLYAAVEIIPVVKSHLRRLLAFRARLQGRPVLAATAVGCEEVLELTMMI